MKKSLRGYLFISLLLFLYGNLLAQNGNLFIRLSQVGFLPKDIKTAVVFSNNPVSDFLYYIRGTEYLDEHYSGRIPESDLKIDNFRYCYSIDFSAFTHPGSYVLEIDGQASYPFIISGDVFNNVTDSLLLFFKVQRCGPTNPLLHLPCHLSDATKVIGDDDSSAVDLTGGWHDAGDYIKFLTTTAYTTYMLIFAYEFDKEKFGFDNDNNNVPDVLEEARVGLDWMLRANYKKGKLITQLQDVRDHTNYWRMPEEDSLRFDRPAYSGMGKNQAGLYTAVMALAARVWEERFLDKEFSQKCLQAALDIFSIRNTIPDIDKSVNDAYQDKEYLGKLALGAAELFITISDSVYLNEASAYAENINAQYWWSWGNIDALAYYRLAAHFPEYIQTLKEELEYFNKEKDKSVFNEGTVYSWGTTNAFLGITLQSILYKRLTGLSTFDSLAVYHRDFILGRNKWGISFINKIGSRYPLNLHSQIFYLNGGNLPGALAAGPAPEELLKKFNLTGNDNYFNMFNTSSSAYYDDRNNYITNEPTIISNATALFVFGSYSDR